MRMVDEDAHFCALQFAADLDVRKFGELPEGGEFFFACHQSWLWLEVMRAASPAWRFQTLAAAMRILMVD